MAGLPPVFVEFLGKSTGVKTAMRDIKAETRAAAAEGESSFSQFGRISKAAVAGIGIAAIAAAADTVHMAADFQTQMTRVRTGAGEAASNMKLVGDGVLAMAGQVGQSTTELTAGLYNVESAGYHGAAALTVLKTAAMGAKVGAADLATTGDALTTAMNAYKMSSGQATQAMNALIATEGQGKTNLEALAGSMSSILPTAAAAHVGLNEVLGAMATMTAQGTPAAVAATYLRQTIGMLSNPSSKAAAEMKDLGLSSIQVSQNLGKNGLASTLNELTGAITQHMGPAGTVLIKHLQDAAKNTSAYQKVLAGLPPAQQTYIGALATMVGGTKSMQAALELTGPHMVDFQNNTKTIAEHVKAGGTQVEGWADVQKTFNQRMAEAKAGIGAMAIQIGNALLPTVTKLAGVLATVVTFLTKHKAIAEALAIVIGGILVISIGVLTVALWNAAAASTALTWPIVLIALAVAALIAVVVLLIMHWRTVWAVIKDVGLAIAHAVMTAWDAVVGFTETAWKHIAQAVSDAWHAVASFFVSAWHTVADPIIHAWNMIVSITTTVWNAILGFFRKWWPLLLVLFLPFVAAALAIWNHFHTQIIGTAKAVWNSISGFFVEIWHDIITLATGAWKIFQTVIIKPIQAVWAFLQPTFHAIASFLSGVWHTITSVASTMWNAIKTAIINPITGAWHSVVSIVGRIGSAIGSGLQSAWNTVSSIGSKFLSIGASIVEGIIHGIENGASALFGSLKNLSNDALNAAKSFLGINSPSKVFADGVGMSIPEGIAKGVTDHAQLAHSAVRNLAGQLSSQTVGIGTAALGAGGGGAAGAGSAAAATAQVTTIVQVDGEELFRVMQPHALLFDRRNSQSGLVYAR